MINNKVAEKLEKLRATSLAFPPNIRRKVNISLDEIEQAIIAALGSETCHSIDPIDGSEFFICSNCNYGAGTVEFLPNYCPNCGREVER